MKAPLTIGLDLGGSKLAAGLVDAAGTVLAVRHWPARGADYDEALDAIVTLVRRLQDDAAQVGGRAAGVGVGAAAFLDADRTRIVHGANLGWHDRPLSGDLDDRLELPITLVNDAGAAAWGEYVHGAGQGQSSIVLVTLGTGVGSGIVIDGQVVCGAHGLGGELGHMPVVVDGRPCVCGGRGCLEQYASATALRRAAQKGARARPNAARRLLGLAGDVEAVDGRHIVAAARTGDPVALAAFDEVGRWLGVGIAHIVALLDPAIVLIGGGLVAAEELILAPARAGYSRHTGIPKLHPSPPLQLARLGANAGVIGAAALARPHPEAGRDAPAAHESVETNRSADDAKHSNSSDTVAGMGAA